METKEFDSGDEVETESTATDSTLVNAGLILRLELEDFAVLKKFIATRLRASVIYQKCVPKRTYLYIEEREREY